MMWPASGFVGFHHFILQFTVYSGHFSSVRLFFIVTTGCLSNGHIREPLELKLGPHRNESSRAIRGCCHVEILFSHEFNIIFVWILAGGSDPDESKPSSE